jgi:hypothetical protein
VLKPGGFKLWVNCIQHVQPRLERVPQPLLAPVHGVVVRQRAEVDAGGGERRHGVAAQGAFESIVALQPEVFTL